MSTALARRLVAYGKKYRFIQLSMLLHSVNRNSQLEVQYGKLIGLSEANRIPKRYGPSWGVTDVSLG